MEQRNEQIERERERRGGRRGGRERKRHRTRLIRFAPSGPVNRETNDSTAEICSLAERIAPAATGCISSPPVIPVFSLYPVHSSTRSRFSIESRLKITSEFRPEARRSSPRVWKSAFAFERKPRSHADRNQIKPDPKDNRLRNKSDCWPDRESRQKQAVKEQKIFIKFNLEPARLSGAQQS